MLKSYAWLRLGCMFLFNTLLFSTYFQESSGPGSSVGIANNYGMYGLESNPGVEQIFRPSRPAVGATQPPVKWVPGLSRG